jgi:ubiquitin carboxyl-terminal hydrolase 8
VDTDRRKASTTLTLTNEVDRRPGSSVQQVLGAFVRKEELEEFSCPRCKHKGPGSMRASLSRLPDVLVLHLQRLTYNGKIRTLVKFPLEALSMLPYTTGR